MNYIYLSRMTGSASLSTTPFFFPVTACLYGKLELRKWVHFVTRCVNERKSFFYLLVGWGAWEVFKKFAELGEVLAGEGCDEFFEIFCFELFLGKWLEFNEMLLGKNRRRLTRQAWRFSYCLLLFERKEKHLVINYCSRDWFGQSLVICCNFA
jgi:hypothetical protein